MGEIDLGSVLLLFLLPILPAVPEPGTLPLHMEPLTYTCRIL
jgi:hypothetical protein